MPYGVDINGTLVGTTAGYESDCLECTGGSYCLSMTVTPDPCGVGNYSEPGQSSCLPCEPGYYCDNDTTSYVDMINNKKCPAGLYCVGALRSLDEATNCSNAKYCPEGNTSVFLVFLGHRDSGRGRGWGGEEICWKFFTDLDYTIH